MEDIFYPSKDGKTTIHAVIWLPESQPRGIIQLIHGMSEYAERYAPLAKFLTANGFIVCADDHLGHGKSVNDESDLGYFDDGHDCNVVLADIRELKLTVDKYISGLPWFVLGHSMGSFFCRKYISLYGKEFKGAIIMGSGFKSAFTLNAALLTVRLNALFYGWRNRSAFIKKLAFGNYNKKFEGRTANDWLSKNADNVDAYEADALCGFDFTNNGYYVLFSIIKQACSNKVIKAIPKDLPVLFVAGGDDPVGDYGKGVLKAAKKFHAAAILDVKVTLYDGCRHEILNDECKSQVEYDILDFINGVLE